ncbi:MAG: GAF domain-containing protein [Opitutaceae bacterium]|nr:GAF domain-containing protein [Opitutaceae bacterium]
MAKSSAKPSTVPVSDFLYAIATLANRELAATVAAQEALAIMARAVRADSGALLLFNPDTNRLEVEASHALADADGLTFDLGQGLPGWVALHTQPVLVADVTTDARYRAVHDRVRCQMAAPLAADDQVLGVVFLDHRRKHGFAPADLATLVALADEATRSLRRLWLLEHLQGKARQLETLITTGQALVAKFEPQELFDTIVRDARLMLGAETATLLLQDPAHETLRCVSLNAARPMAAPAGDLAVATCLAGATLNTRRQTEFADVQSPEFRGLADLPSDPGLHSVLITPLIYEQETLGALAVYSGRVHRFDNDAKRLAAALASLGAVALQNTRLYARVFRSEETLRKSEQLTTLGLLAAEIAHEIRNPLTVLKLLHGGLGLDFAPDDPRRTDLRIINEKLDQLEGIVTRVLQFGKAPQSLHSRWSLAEIVNDTLLLVRLKLAQAKVQVRFDPPARAPLVDAHKGQLQQVLLNVILNAMQAMPAGGTLTLTLGAESGQATLDVADTGSGIAAGIRDRIFDSFLSGREGGTGLGLAIAKRVMLSHHGDIVLVATGPTGTTLRLNLPLAR